VPLVVDYSASRRLVVDYFASAACPGASARRTARHAAHRAARRRLLQLAQARRRLLHLRRVSRCLGTSRGSSRGSSRRSSSTTPPRAGSSSTTSPPPRVRVPRHVAWLLVRLIVDYFAHAVCPGASARHAARCRLLRLHCASGCLARCATRCRLLRLCCVIGCLGLSHGSSSTSHHLRRSTSRRSVALSLTVRWSLRLAAQVLVAQLHWLNCLCRASGHAVFTARQLATGRINSLPRQHS
jgi:hypothetical protein